ncbi:MAG: ATP-binding protein [Calditrichales bacterium]|nr:ATP-binding protein [Calditrichales bacterium]
MLRKRIILNSIVRWLDRDEIIIISGPRRVGKTTILHLLNDELLKRGVETKNIFMLNLEDLDILKELTKSPKELLKFVTNEKEKNYFLIDEIQYLEEPTNFLKYLYDLHRDKVKLIVTGSYLLEVKGKFKDSLVGRKIGFNLTPLTFEEFVDFKKNRLLPYFKKTEIPETIRIEILSLLEEYLIYGGMPEIVLTKDTEMKRALLKEYVNTYLKKDIRYISGSDDILRYNDLLSVISNQISGLLNLEEICNTLGMTRRKVEKYLENFILSSLIYILPPYYTNIRTQISKMKKVFLFDTGVRNQVVQNFNSTNNRNDAGALFENFILNELMNAVGKESLFYFRTKTGSEIDFIIRKDKVIPAEIKYKKMNAPSKTRSLSNFIEKNNLEKGYLVNLTLNQMLDDKKIEVVDFLKFLNRLRQF